MRAALLTLVAALAAPVAGAQGSFTELALSDTTMNSSPYTDLWINSAAPADFDADGDLDLLIVGTYVDYQPPWGDAEQRLTVYRNDGAIGDTAWALTAVPVPFDDQLGTRGDLAWGDYDADGDPDVVVGSQGVLVDYERGALALYRNDGGALVRTPTLLPAYREDSSFDAFDHRSLAWADADNDGDLDLLVPSTWSTGAGAYTPTMLLRNDGPAAGDAWAFAETQPGLAVTQQAASAWGDMDEDGDLDLLLANVDYFGTMEERFVRTYRNDDGAFTQTGSFLPDLRSGTVDWGDADGDGDLDVLYAGQVLNDGWRTDEFVRIFFSDGAAYDTLTVLTAHRRPGHWMDFGAASWADYDSDGDVDLLAAGDVADSTGRFYGHARVYANDGGAFELAADLPAPNSELGGTFTWFDVDADGDLDFFVTGGYDLPNTNMSEARARLFRNDAVAPNAPPTAPAGLSAAPAVGGVTLAWAPSEDDHTPEDALTYNLWVRAATGSDIVSPMAVPDGSGQRLVPEAGNVSHNTSWTLRDLPDGLYTWTVQAVDNAFNGGVFAAEGTFTVGTVASEPGVPPAALALHGVAPNPAAGAVALAFDLPAPAEVGVRVFDVLGREVLVVAGHRVEAGANREIALPARALPAGTYLVRLEVRAGGVMEQRIARLTVVH